MRSQHIVRICFVGVMVFALASCSRGPVLPRNLAESAKALKQGRPDLAIDAVSQMNAKTVEHWSLLAEACRMLPCDGVQVETLFKTAAASDDPSVVLLAARSAMGADRLATAQKWLEGGRQRQPKAPELTIELSKLEAQMGHYARSAELLRPLVGKDPRILNLLGYSELLAGNLEISRAYLERSIAEAQHHGRAYAPAQYHLGRYFLAKGELEEARRHFELARAANPKHLEASYLDFAAAELEGNSAAGREGRENFAKLFGAALEAQGALGELPAESVPAEVSHRDDIESRPLAEGQQFKRTFPSGSAVEFGCHVPAQASVFFSVRITAGPGEGELLLETIHAAPGPSGEWVPHRLELPPGAAGAETTIEFSVQSASRLARLFGRPAPEGAAFSEPASLPPSGSRSKDTRPNILLISLDTLRADAVSAYGATRKTTPSLDALAAGGVRVEQAESANNWTLPSHYSIFSGLTPRAHGVLPDMSQVRGYLYPDRRLRVRGSGRERMLAEALSDAGYRSSAVTENGWISGRFGFDQGFRVYRSDLRGSLPRTLAASLGELESSGEHGPWFLFVHTYTAHQPYHAPESYRLRWADPDHVGFAWPRARVGIADYYRFRAPFFPPAPSDIEVFRDLYYGQVAWADSLVGELVAWLRERGLLEQTVIAVTSDHGEEIFERGQFDHGDTLYEEVTHVPLILHAPGRLPSGRVIRGPVSLVDLSATLLDLSGEPGELGQGRSLLPLIPDDAPDSEGPVFAEGIAFDGRELVACWLGRYKYLRRGQEGEGGEELYDLLSDPAETHDLASTRPHDLLRLRQLYQAHAAESAAIQQALGSGEEELDEETIQRLKSLGYAN